MRSAVGTISWSPAARVVGGERTDDGGCSWFGVGWSWKGCAVTVGMLDFSGVFVFLVCDGLIQREEN